MSRRKLWFISASIAGHVALGVGIFASGIWQIDRLDRDHSSIASIAVAMPPPPAPSGGMSLPKVEIQVKERPKTVVKEPVQPVTKPLESKLPDVPSTGGGDGPDKGPGKGPGDLHSIGTCETPPCGEVPQPKQDPPKPVPVIDDKPITLPPNDLSLMHIGGTTEVHPSDMTKNAMLRDGHLRSVGVLKVCVSETGAITSVTMIGSTKYAEYDARLLEAVRGWTYKPYAAKGRALKVCGTVTFQYSLKS